MPPSAPFAATNTERSAWAPPAGVPLALFAACALVASCLGRSLGPAMLGAATGLATWIDRTSEVGSVLSQLVAAGGVAFALRAVAITFQQTGLGVGFRMVVIPAATAASVLIMAATGRVLEPELGSSLVVAALTTAAAGSAVAMMAPATRGVGFALALSSLAGAFDFAGIRSYQAAVDNASPALYKLSTAFATAGFAFEALLVALAIGWLSARRSSRALALSGASLALVLFWGWALRGAAQPGASPFQIVIARAVTSWLRAPSPLVPPAARVVLEAASSVAAIGALVVSLRVPLAAVVALCLLARGATDIPLPALLLVVAALAVPSSGLVPPRALRAEPHPTR